MTESLPKEQRKPFKKIALSMQGGGALGAFEAGAYEALHEIGLEPQIVSGISIGAFNGSVIAGNKPEDRLKKLKEFWNAITKDLPRSRDALTQEEHARADADSAQYFARNGVPYLAGPISGVDQWRLMFDEMVNLGIDATLIDQAQKNWEVWFGRRPEGLYSNDKQEELLRRVVNFDYLNRGKSGEGEKGRIEHFGVGAANFYTGKIAFFDNGNCVINPEHIKASGALIPAVPPVKIDGVYYADGGLISNNPRKWAVDKGILDPDTLSFKIHLYDARDSRNGDARNSALARHRMTHSDHGEDESASPSVRARARANLKPVWDRYELYQAKYDSFDEARKQSDEGKRLKEKAERLKAEAEGLKAIADGADCGHKIDVYYDPPEYARADNNRDFARSSMQARWDAGYNNTIKSLCLSGQLDRLSEDAVKKLATHILNEYPEILDDLAKGQPGVLKLICSKEVLQQPDKQEGDRHISVTRALAKLTPEHLRIVWDNADPALREGEPLIQFAEQCGQEPANTGEHVASLRRRMKDIEDRIATAELKERIRKGPEDKPAPRLWGL